MPNEQRKSIGWAQIIEPKVSITATVAAAEVTGYSLDAPMSPTHTQRVLTRFREEMTRLELTQTDVSTFSGLSQSKISKIMHGVLELGLEDAGKLCAAVGLSLTEAVRDRGMEFCAEMTPTEMRFLELLRSMTQADRDAFFQLAGAKVKTEPRRALPSKVAKKRSSVR